MNICIRYKEVNKMSEEVNTSNDVDQFGRKLYDAVCSDCGNACKVPFKPIEGRAVYCKDCYMKHRKDRY